MAGSDDTLFLSAFTASPIGIALENLEGRPLFVNPALCSMLGFSEEEMRSKQCVEFSPPEDAQKDWALFQQLRAGSIDQYHLEKRFFRRDGSLIWGRLSVRLVNRLASPLVLAMVEDISEKKAAEENLGGRLIQAQEAERTRIARELHDDINQRLVLLAMDLSHQLRQNPLASAPEFRNGIEEVIKQIRDLVKDIQALSHRLHSSNLEYLGLTVAAESFCREISNRQAVKIDYHCEGISKQLPKEISLCLFRVLQEALQNAIKHSGSRNFEVSLSGEANEIHLTVRDRGTGFNPAEAMKGHGLGLTSMKERLKLIDGELSIESKLGAGTTIHARVSLKERTKAAAAGGADTLVY